MTDHSPAPATDPATRHPFLFRVFYQFHFLEKAITIIFAFLVFTIISRHIRYHRDLLSYIGIMLMVTMAYLEILIIRDHLWVLEGALPEARRWRDVFFTKQSLSHQRWRKILVVVFALFIFTYVYVKTQGSEIYSFLGIILMVTVLYFEVLSIRDEVQVLVASLQARRIEQSVLGKEVETASLPAFDTDTDGLQPQEDDD